MERSPVVKARALTTNCPACAEARPAIRDAARRYPVQVRSTFVRLTRRPAPAAIAARAAAS